MPAPYYLDTSALLPRLLKRAPGHAWVEHICGADSQNVIALAEITEAEIAASLNQLVRGGTLRQKLCNDALALFWSQVKGNEYTIIPVTTPIVRRAADLCGMRALKGYDAVQLACALIFREDVRRTNAANTNPDDLALADPIFLTEDERLHDEPRLKALQWIHPWVI
ncbi:MAG: type II toxin-antitoxin system VapC family toxin [Ktedonobacterales bacterium]